MAFSSSRLYDEKLTLVFGPQTLDFDEALAKDLRSALLTNSNLEWIVDAVLQLPQHWKSVSRTLPFLQRFMGLHHLEALSTWIRIGEFPEGSFPLPNTILTPLVVITHLIQYSNFLDLLYPKTVQRDHLQAPFRHFVETLGLCTGMLTSATVSSSGNLAQLEKNGSVAIRLAMAIGAFVDAKETEIDPHGAWSSISVGWNSTDLDCDLSIILEEFPEVRPLKHFRYRTEANLGISRHICPWWPKREESQLQHPRKTLPPF